VRSGLIALCFSALLCAVPSSARAQSEPSASESVVESERAVEESPPVVEGEVEREAEVESEGEVESEREAEVESEGEVESELEAEAEAESQPEPTNLVPGVADARLAQTDDGIDEIFAAWASERLFTGPTRSGSSLMLHTELGVRFGITRDARARVDWGFAFTSSHVQGLFADTPTTTVPYDGQVERVEAQNPTLQLEWAPVIGTTRFSFGLGVAAPTAAGENIATSVTQAAVYDASSITHELMLAATGGLGAWRYRRERMGLFLPLSFLFAIEQITIAIEGAAAISAPVTGAGPVPVTGDLQADLQISGDLIPEVRLGARFAIALLDIGASRAPGTIVQPSATGFVRVRLDPGFLIASILADLGGYYGLNSQGGVWAITLGGGAAIP
jgi:hypothetical protein